MSAGLCTPIARSRGDARSLAPLRGLPTALPILPQGPVLHLTAHWLQGEHWCRAGRLGGVFLTVAELCLAVSIVISGAQAACWTTPTSSSVREQVVLVDVDLSQTDMCCPSAGHTTSQASTQGRARVQEGAVGGFGDVGVSLHCLLSFGEMGVNSHLILRFGIECVLLTEGIS